MLVHSVRYVVAAVINNYHIELRDFSFSQVGWHEIVVHWGMESLSSESEWRSDMRDACFNQGILGLSFTGVLRDLGDLDHISLRSFMEYFPHAC